MSKKLSFLLIPFMLVSLIACSSTPKHRSMGEVFDDGVISNKLKVRYIKDKIIKASKINIDTRRGVVSLKGVVDSQDQINRAIELAEKQAGVREVKSYLMMRGGSERAAPVEKAKKSKKQGLEERDVEPSKKSDDEAAKPADPMELGDDIDPPRVFGN